MEEIVKHKFYPTMLLKDRENELRGVRFTSETPDLYIDIVSIKGFSLPDIERICDDCDRVSSIYELKFLNKDLLMDLPSTIINYTQTLLKREVTFDYSKDLYRVAFSYNEFINSIITTTRFFRNKNDYDEFCAQIEASNYLFSEKIKPALRIAEICFLEYDFINKNTIVISLSIFTEVQLMILISQLESDLRNMIKISEITSRSSNEIISYIPTIDKLSNSLKEEISAFACKTVPKLSFWNGIYDSPSDVFAYVGNNGKLVVGYFGENRWRISRKCKDTCISCIKLVLDKTILAEIACDDNLEYIINMPYFDIDKHQTITFKFSVDWNFAGISKEKLLSCFENTHELCRSIINAEYEDVNPLPLLYDIEVSKDDNHLVFKFIFESISCESSDFELFLEEDYS